MLLGIEVPSARKLELQSQIPARAVKSKKWEPDPGARCKNSGPETGAYELRRVLFGSELEIIGIRKSHNETEANQ